MDRNVKTGKLKQKLDLRMVLRVLCSGPTDLAEKIVNVMHHKKKLYHALKLAGKAQAPTSQHKPIGSSPNPTPQLYVLEISPGDPWHPDSCTETRYL